MTKFATDLPKDLVDAYKSTHFEVDLVPQFILKIGEFNDDLQNLFTKLNCKSGCFITAFNPESAELSAEENKKFQESLYRDLMSSGHYVADGFGSDPTGKWDGEPSFFVTGISLLDAKTLGTKYGQNAIVWCDERCVPDLILLR